ncbi:hypothetical protein K1719_037909 [Acacia pycnantha]|nr:hypothetical protein K1719_037909 [Acacia pycnantha]
MVSLYIIGEVPIRRRFAEQVRYSASEVFREGDLDVRHDPGGARDTEVGVAEEYEQDAEDEHNWVASL